MDDHKKPEDSRPPQAEDSKARENRGNPPGYGNGEVTGERHGTQALVWEGRADQRIMMRTQWAAAASARWPQQSAEYRDDCGEPIPDRRRQALPGVRTCVTCQAVRDSQIQHGSFNRRGSKDSQLR